MKAVEDATASMKEMDDEEKDWTGSVGHKDWTGSYGVFGKDASKDVLAERQKEIAAADAVAAGTKQNLIGLTVQLNELEKQFTEEKAKQKGTGLRCGSREVARRPDRKHEGADQGRRRTRQIPREAG